MNNPKFKYPDTKAYDFVVDRLAKRGVTQSDLAKIVYETQRQYEPDVTLQIATIYGTIGTTNFGYFDRVKSGIMKKFDTSDLHVNTFIDDLLSAIVAAVCGKIAHKYA